MKGEDGMVARRVVVCQGVVAGSAAIAAGISSRVVDEEEVVEAVRQGAAVRFRGGRESRWIARRLGVAGWTPAHTGVGALVPGGVVYAPVRSEGGDVKWWRVSSGKERLEIPEI